MEKKSVKKLKSTPEYDSQRQQNVLLEQIHTQVKTIAEGHGYLVKSVDEIKATLSEHDGHFDRIEMVVTENRKDIKGLKSDVGELKSGQEGLKATVKKIEQKLDVVTTDHEQRIRKLETV